MTNNYLSYFYWDKKNVFKMLRMCLKKLYPNGTHLKSKGAFSANLDLCKMSKYLMTKILQTSKELFRIKENVTIV